jgi:hypothetical protein
MAAALGGRGPQKNQNKWFLVGPVAAGLNFPEASGRDDTDKNG